MAVLKATAFCPNAATRNSLINAANNAAATWAVRPGREVTVVNETGLGPNVVRVKAITTNDAELNRIFPIVENRMDTAGVLPPSEIRTTLDNDSVGPSRFWT